jgi:hypothetical protein
MVSLVGELIYALWFPQADFIVEPQGLDGNEGQIGKIADLHRNSFF